MPTPNDKKLANAHQRLVRIERLIGSHSEPETPQHRPARSEWVPGDFLIKPEQTSVTAQEDKQKA